MTVDLHRRLLGALGDRFDNYHVEVDRRGAALRAVIELHAPEQHYAIGQDNKRRPTWLWCCRCRQKSPCEEILTIAQHLGIRDEGDH